MAVDIFHWRSLTQAIIQIRAAGRLLQDKIFRTTDTHYSEDIDVDVVVGGQKIAPFVSPVDGGVVIAKLGQQMKTIKAPRIRLKKPLSAKDLLTVRTPGSQLYAAEAQELAEYQRRKVALEQKDLKNMILRTTEWMCAQALSGSLSVTQENVAFEIDYGLPSAHKPVLGSGSKWTEAGGKPVDDIRTWKRLVEQALGYSTNIAIAGCDAVDALLGNAQVQNLLDNRRISIGQLSIEQPQFIGTISGVDIFEYNAGYDVDGTYTPFIPADKFVLIATEARFVLHYGLIIDLEAGVQVAKPFFSKSWMEKDPSARWLLVESRPLPVPGEPEAIVYADVV